MGSKSVEPGRRCRPPENQPASQQGGKGKIEKSGRRSQGGDGGAMVRARIFGAREKGKFSSKSTDFITCVLWIGGWEKPCTSFQPSETRLGGFEENCEERESGSCEIDFDC